jgi:hypothetical protein
VQNPNEVITWHFFYVAPNGDREKGRLGIGKLGLGYGLGFFLVIRRNFK